MPSTPIADSAMLEVRARVGCNRVGLDEDGGNRTNRVVAAASDCKVFGLSKGIIEPFGGEGEVDLISEIRKPSDITCLVWNVVRRSGPRIRSHHRRIRRRPSRRPFERKRVLHPPPLRSLTRYLIDEHLRHRLLQPTIHDRLCLRVPATVCELLVPPRAFESAKRKRSIIIETSRSNVGFSLPHLLLISTLFGSDAADSNGYEQGCFALTHGVHDGCRPSHWSKRTRTARGGKEGLLIAETPSQGPSHLCLFASTWTTSLCCPSTLCWRS